MMNSIMELNTPGQQSSPHVPMYPGSNRITCSSKRGLQEGHPS